MLLSHVIWERLYQSEHQSLFPMYNTGITPTFAGYWEDQNYLKE